MKSPIVASLSRVIGISTAKNTRTVATVALLALSMSFPALITIAAAEVPEHWDTKSIDGTERVAIDALKPAYDFEKLSRDGAKLTLENNKIGVRLEIGSKTCVMNGIRFNFALPVIEQENVAYISLTDLQGMLDPALRPAAAAGTGDFHTIILDPAGGGKDKRAGGRSEAAFTLNVARLAKEQLEQKGMHVVMTRDDDDGPGIEKRRDIANNVAEDAVFIGITLGESDLAPGGGSDSLHGMSTYALAAPPAAAKDPSDVTPPDFSAASLALATSIHGTAIRRIGAATGDGGITRDTASVLSAIRHPAIILNAGYTNRPPEEKMIENDRYQMAIASAICDGLSKYRFAISGTPVVPKQPLSNNSAGNPPAPEKTDPAPQESPSPAKAESGE